MTYEAFEDAAYYHFWCVRPVGASVFGDGFHIANRDEAERLRDLLNSMAVAGPGAGQDGADGSGACVAGLDGGTAAAPSLAVGMRVKDNGRHTGWPHFVVIAIKGGKAALKHGWCTTHVPLGSIHTDGKPRRSGWSVVT
jgi:hypothetical protein